MASFSPSARHPRGGPRASSQIGRSTLKAGYT